jgi:hypothetical protein
MSWTVIKNKLGIAVGGGVTSTIATSCFVTSWVNVEEHRRLSFTFGVGSATGQNGIPTVPGDVGGFTGWLQIEGTNETPECYGATGGTDPGMGSRPGRNGYTGARYWAPLNAQSIGFGAGASGGGATGWAVSNAIGGTGGANPLLITLDYVGPAYVRAKFNQTASGAPFANATACGSGTIDLYMTAKHG